VNNRRKVIAGNEARHVISPERIIGKAIRAEAATRMTDRMIPASRS
jgi:hypothetical protein